MELEFKRGEIWQDGEGVLMCIESLDPPTAWFFGTRGPLEVDSLSERDKPRKKVFDQRGNYVGDGELDYPNGSVFRNGATF